MRRGRWRGGLAWRGLQVGEDGLSEGVFGWWASFESRLEKLMTDWLLVYFLHLSRTAVSW